MNLSRHCHSAIYNTKDIAGRAHEQHRRNQPTKGTFLEIVSLVPVLFHERQSSLLRISTYQASHPSFFTIPLVVIAIALYIGWAQFQTGSNAEMASSTRPLLLNRSLFNKDLYKRVRSMWFADLPANATHSNEASNRRWFYNPDKDAALAFDRSCHADFYPALESLLPEKLKLPPFTTWAEERASASTFCNPFLSEVTPENPKSEEDVESASYNALSIMILLDQMPRNIFRNNQKLIYTHFDRLSQALLHKILSTEPRLDLAPSILHSPVMRNWFYLPLMHSESLDDHEILDRLYREMQVDMREKGDEEALKSLEMGLDFERKHVDILKQFGRYPYRSKYIGRETTPEEEKWMESGENFGTG